MSNFDIDDNRVVLVPDPNEIGGLEKLKTMDCDEIFQLLCDAMTTLQCQGGQFFMANCLKDLVWPIWKQRDRKQYRLVLASEYPDAPGKKYWGSPEDLAEGPEVDPAELGEGPVSGLVLMKRVPVNG
jgi:hypothetical protein